MLAAPPSSTGFTDTGRHLRPNPESVVEVHGSFRARGSSLYNLDLDRGPNEAGQALFPVSASDPDEQLFWAGDLRIRTDLSAQAPGGVVGLQLRVDWVDNLAFGEDAGAERFLRIKRAYGEVVTPLGYLAAGRMGHHFGLGMVANAGDCDDCDSGDSADRVAFATALAGHVWAVAFDLSTAGHQVERRHESLVVDVEPSAAARTVNVAVLKHHGPRALERRRRADRTTAEYGAFYSYRWQDRDVPADWLPIESPPPFDAGQVVHRGLTAHALDLWLRITHPWFRLEMEAAWLHARVENASLFPGVELAEPALSEQLGLAFTSEIGRLEGPVIGGIDAGFASGDPVPSDARVDAFRFHPDHRIDRILFRELIGTVTNAIYVRPHLTARLVELGSAGRLVLDVAAVASWAHHAEVTPGRARALGIEIDPTLRYTTDTGFLIALEYAALFPFEGLDNPAEGLDARIAQLVRLRAGFGF